MVVFTCQHCNASLKRTLVSKHYTTVCRNSIYLTCIDCLKDFRGDEYNDHNICITEDERYGDKNFKPKPTAVKQTEWIDVVYSCAKKNEHPKYKVIFSKLSSFSNVPRKRDRFMNFIKSSVPKIPPHVSSEIFDIISEEFTKQKNAASLQVDNKNKTIAKSDESSDQVKVEEGAKKSEKKKKKKRNENSESNEGVQGTDNEVVDNGKKKRNKANESSCLIQNINNQAVGSKKKKQNESSESYEVQTNEIDNGVTKKKKKKAKRSDLLSPDNVQTLKSGNIAEIFNITKEDEKTNLEHVFFHKTGDESEEKENVHDNSIRSETDQNGVNVEGENKGKLSKKEMKKLKKKQKFEAELKDLQESKVCINEHFNEKPDENNDQDSEKVSKKRKKRNATKSESEIDGGKRRKIEDNEAEYRGMGNEDKVNEEEEHQTKAKGKFNWEEVIKEILRKSSDREMSVKRISKKVLAEYQAVKGERESYEQLISKFNKKINKTIGVRVLKDKAKLISDD